MVRKLAEEKAGMKRYGNLWQLICARENIEKAADNALKGKKINKEREQFIANRKALLDELEQSLINETYKFNPLRSFVVYEPKERIIHHPPFYPDKILHHCLMNIIHPFILEKLTADAYGSLKGRGVTMALNKLKPILKNNPSWYYLKIDCRKYYSSIYHEVCKNAVRRVIKCKKTLRMIDEIIDVHEEGLAIGIYPSQYLANLVLAGVDHWVKEVERLPYYFRYMDDILLILPSKEVAHVVLEKLIDKLNELKLQVKNNVRIAPVSCGIDFIGYVLYPTHTRLRKRIKLNLQRSVRNLTKLGVDDATLKLKTASHFGWAKHANCRNLLRTTFGDKIYLYEKNMEIKRLSEIRGLDNWFGVPKEKRISIKDLFNKEIIFFDFLITTIKNESKVVVKFAFVDNPDDFHIFITRSDVMKDRLERDKDVMPFIATIKQIKNYTAYE